MGQNATFLGLNFGVWFLIIVANIVIWLLLKPVARWYMGTDKILDELAEIKEQLNRGDEPVKCSSCGGETKIVNGYYRCEKCDYNIKKV